MDYSCISVPFINRETIRKEADMFRQKFWDSTIPVDIEKIIDVKLRLDIIPIPGLEKLCDTNALITSDWQSVYVDKDIFEDERRQNRLRFSYAHEIGHFILHRDIYSSFCITEIEDFYKLIELFPGEQYGYIETQANIFASFLLVPRETLGIERKKELDKIRGLRIDDEDMLNSYVANSLSKIFAVSPESMEIILNEYKNED